MDGGDVTQILRLAERGDPAAAGELLLVYQELRRLAGQKLATEQPGHTLQATALVHEAYFRLVGSPAQQKWDGRRHIFGAAAEAMRRILVESARRRHSQKRGGEWERQPLDAVDVAAPEEPDELLALDEALGQLAAADPAAAELLKLRYFAGMSIPEAAYKLLERLGEGGMGVVYMAEQEHPVRRRVALKIIKPGMDSAQVVARIEAERQALAMMDHVNIARVVDAGTPTPADRSS